MEIFVSILYPRKQPLSCIYQSTEEKVPSPSEREREGTKNTILLKESFTRKDLFTHSAMATSSESRICFLTCRLRTMNFGGQAHRPVRVCACMEKRITSPKSKRLSRKSFRVLIYTFSSYFPLAQRRRKLNNRRFGNMLITSSLF